MAARLGEVLFWASLILAALWFYFILGPGGAPKGDVTVYLTGAVIVAIGWALRYILADRKS
jgi:hypothetical protein